MLLGAIVILVLLGHVDLFTEPFLPTFAISGALHAMALVLSLRVAARTARKCLFMVLAALLNVAVLYTGIAGLQFLAVLPSGVRLYTDLAACSGLGALTYGLLVRYFWNPALRPRSIVKVLVTCIMTTLLALAARNLSDQLGMWWFIAIWWLTFSAMLGVVDDRRGRPHVLRPHTDTE